jgi:hypothetical protein
MAAIPNNPIKDALMVYLLNLVHESSVLPLGRQRR